MYNTNNHRVIFVGGGIVLLIIFASLTSVIAYKFINHEKIQNDRIQSLENKLASIITSKKAKEFNAELIFQENNYNYLAIGNSITKHPLADYWWSECGMAATSTDKDYYHIVLNHLKEEKDDVISNAYNFSIWETLYTDRAETLEVLDYYLDEFLSLITVQLGENAQNLDTFESDFEYLINHIQEASPSAEIIVIGDFWENKNRDEMKKEAAERCGVKYISLNEMNKNKKEYECGIGTEVFGEDGKVHTVEHSGVAAHPNDEAMRYIADKIIENISR